MKDIKDLLAAFLELIKLTPSGSQVQFSINYMKDEYLTNVIVFIALINPFCFYRE